MTPLIRVNSVSVHFPMPVTLIDRIRGQRRTLQAVSDVDLVVRKGQSVGVVGESGSGKTTLARALVGLQSVTSGTIEIDRPNTDDDAPRPLVQMVFQDPSSSLDPRQTVRQAIGEILRVRRVVPKRHVERRTRELISSVGLPNETLDVLPRRLSGGQRQRVSIARALAAEPAVLVADEAVASLDVSVKAGILNLLRDLQRDLNLTLVLITHDLATVGHACDDIAVMYLGRIVEYGAAHSVLSAPVHPYTQALLAAAPRLHRQRPELIKLTGEIPSPLDPPSGCGFRTRCPHAYERCSSERPVLRAVPPDRHVACHLPVGAAVEAPIVRSPRDS